MARRRRQRKVKDGDGSHLKPFRWWHGIYRTQFGIEHTGHRYTLDVDLFDWDERAYLYRDGRQHAVSTMPAAFAVPGGQIEAATSFYGMKRAHLVRDGGQEAQLHPAPGTGEAWRARLAVRRPRLSQAMAITAVVVLLAALAVWVPQAAEAITGIPWVAEALGGSWTSPVALPGWLTIALTVAGAAAAAERALSLRNHWLIDADVAWLG